MKTEQLGLFGLPSRGIMGVVEGFKAMPAGPGPAYICCQQLSPKVIVRNPAVRLVDLYKLSARTKPASTTPASAPAATTAVASTTTAAAAAGGSGSKRPAGQLEDRPGKRQQQQQPEQEHITAVSAARPQQQQQQAGASAISGVRGGPHLQQQQQQTSTAPQPLTALPNAMNIPTTTAAAAAGSCTASKQLLQYTPEQMMMFSNKRLTELLKACGLKVAGKKEELVRRLMEYQRRVRKAAQASSTAIPHARGARA